MAASKHSGPHLLISCPLLIVILALGTYILWIGIAPSAPQPTAHARGDPLNEILVTSINSSGNVCRKVIFVAPLKADGQYQVGCQVQDLSKASKIKSDTAIYRVDLKLGKVKPLVSSNEIQP